MKTRKVGFKSKLMNDFKKAGGGTQIAAQCTTKNP